MVYDELVGLAWLARFERGDHGVIVWRFQVFSGYVLRLFWESSRDKAVGQLGGVKMVLNCWFYGIIVIFLLSFP